MRSRSGGSRKRGISSRVLVARKLPLGYRLASCPINNPAFLAIKNGPAARARLFMGQDARARNRVIG
jgi:hypothetical protein